MDEAKLWIFAGMFIALVTLTVVAYDGWAGASSERAAPESRWRQIEAPRPDLECWETLMSQGTGQRHVECWPTATIGGE